MNTVLHVTAHGATTICVALSGGEQPDAAWISRLQERAGAPAAVAGLREALAGASGDVVVVTAEVVVPDGWLAALAERPAALAVGTVTAAVVEASDPVVLGASGARMRELGRPVTAPPAPGPCVLLCREALALVDRDGLDPEDAAAFVAGFATRCAERGLANLVSDRLVVGGAPPERADWASGHAAEWARQATTGLSVTIDARSLDGAGPGTRVHTLELVRALAGRERLALRVVLPPKTDASALAVLRALPGVELRTYAEVVNSGIVTDVVHRPYQVFTVHDLLLLQRLGRRIVITQQDQLLYRSPSYFASPAEWEDYRQACRIALAWADRVVFFTEHARDEALRDELLEPAQAAVLPIGIDHDKEAVEPRAPAGVDAQVPFLLQLGTDLAHKNRPFAIRLLRVLRAQGWEGELVLAGPHAEHGSSRAEEERLLAGGDLPVRVLDAVSAAERGWLLEHCAAVLFPSVEEGFGLVPFEAGAAGRPCLFAPVGAMAETLPAEAATLVPWDAAASAAAALPLLRDGEERERHVALLREAAARHRWAATAERAEVIYDSVLAAPIRQVAPIVAAEIEHQRRYEDFRARTGDDAMSLLGPDGFLPPDALRPLLAVLSRPPLRRALLALLRVLYRFGHR